jgi:hypothetical protein
MKTNLLKYVLLTVLAFLMSCQKDNKTISELIIGKWEWIKTIESPYTGQVSNPQTSGFSKTLEFTRDGTMKEYKNDLLINSSNYSIEIDPSTPNYNLLTYNSINHSHFYMVNDSLIFNEAFVDGAVSSYLRKK